MVMQSECSRSEVTHARQREAGGGFRCGGSCWKAPLPDTLDMALTTLQRLSICPAAPSQAVSSEKSGLCLQGDPAPKAGRSWQGVDRLLRLKVPGAVFITLHRAQSPRKQYVHPRA